MHFACQHTRYSAAPSSGGLADEKPFSKLDSRSKQSQLTITAASVITFEHDIQDALLPTYSILFFSNLHWQLWENAALFFFFLSVLCPQGLFHPSLISTSYFKWSVFCEKTGFHTYCQSFSLLIPPYLYFQLFLFLCCISFWCGDIDANTMCLFISLSRAWKTAYSRKVKQPSLRSVMVILQVSVAMLLKVASGWLSTGNSKGRMSDFLK